VTRRTLIGERLLAAGRIDAWQLQSALGHQRRWGGRLGEVLVALGFVDEDVVLREVADQQGVPLVAIRGRRVPETTVALVPERLIRSRRVFPLAVGRQTRRGPLVLATTEPHDLAVLDEVAFATGLAVEPVLVSERDLEDLVARHLDGRAVPASPRGVELPGDGGLPMQLVPFAHGLY
jgi:type IV pilus assembly protein PilB